MTDRVRMLEKLRQELSEIPQGASIDLLTIANGLAARYSVPFEEIRAIVKEEARARGIDILDPKSE